MEQSQAGRYGNRNMGTRKAVRRADIPFDKLERQALPRSGDVAEPISPQRVIRAIALAAAVFLGIALIAQFLVKAILGG